MKGRSIAAIVLLMLVVGIATPMLSTGTDALESDDYYITVPGTQAPSKSVEATLGNGESRTWTLCVVNVSENYLNVYFTYSIASKDAKVTEVPDATLIGPEGSSEPSVAKGNLTIAIDSLSDSYDSLNVCVVAHIMDASDPETVLETEINFNIEVVSVYDTEGVYNKFLGIFLNTLPEPFNSPWITAITTILVLGFLAWFIGTVLLGRVAKSISRSSTDEDAERFKKGTNWLIVVLVTLISIHLAVQIVDADTSIISAIGSWVYIFSIILVTIILWRLYNFVIETSLRNFEKANLDSAIDTSLVPLFKMIGRIIFWVGGVSAVLASFGVDLQGILVSAGVISLGITLGAQNVLSQFFSGMVILVTRPFRAGDYLKINENVYIVKKVRLMYTEFTNWAGDAIITIPNNVVSSATVSNMTKGDAVCRQYVYFSVAYGTDLKKAQAVMVEAAKKCELVVNDKDHEITTRITEFLSSGIELRLSVYAPTFDDTGDVAGKLRGLVYEAFNENGIEIPYDRVQIDILSDYTEKGSKH